jgi:hypothetical protein
MCLRNNSSNGNSSGNVTKSYTIEHSLMCQVPAWEPCCTFYLDILFLRNYVVTHSPLSAL